MQSKLTKEMELQMEKGQRINSKLDKIQQIAEEYYENKGFLNTISEILKLEEITLIANQLQSNKALTQQQKVEMYQVMAEQFLAFEVQTVLFLRKFECLLLLSKILMLTIKIEDEEMFIHNLLEQIQLLIFKEQQLHVSAIIIEQYKIKPQTYKYNEQNNAQELVKSLVQTCQREFMDDKFQKRLENQCREEYKNKMNQFQSYYQGQNLKKLQEQSKYLVEHLLKINKSLGLMAFSDYATSYTFQKLNNRLLLIPEINDINNQILMKQLAKHHKVIKEEFYGKESIQSNNNYYQKILKQGLKIKEEQSSSNQVDNNMVLIQKVLHEFKIFEILKQSQNQMIKKLVFGNELDEQASSQKQSLGQLMQGL
ncbi:unnamed protein product (macronuclear) [Paramecium tetraurelia]|uniref:Uncharacterized protein n=1 Tax=Paramecium tetraurelia TaxID=5888 RepID=A0C818_PARTE|nr:uncharacterized protein GSPATT00036066001 [Paramecium tetraurelia]CAK66935.1 unnamed protein product [Paramecium tetraurelia]|eukprot:XP_001434332.1 hypothetical protein (macronuclear) [Paramecium tetraurelia strain d4-2]